MLTLYANDVENADGNDVKILWHADPSLGNDREINNYTTAAAK
jgi:hypothetical protein